MLPVVIHETARDDIHEQVDYLDSEGGEALGDEFITQCIAGFERVSRFPESDALVLRYRKLDGCRFIPVPGFPKTLIF